MAFYNSFRSRLAQARLGLRQRDGLKLRLAGSLVLGIVAIALLCLIFFLISVQLYRANAAPLLGVDRFELFRTAAYGLAGFVAISALATASWKIFRAHEAHLCAAEQTAAEALSIIEASPGALLTVDINGVILSCNQAAERMFGYEAGKLIGQKISALIPQRHFLHDMAALGRQTMIAFGQRRNYQTFPVELSISEAPHHIRRSFIVLIHDASGRKHSEETVHHISLSVSSMTGENFVRSLLQQLSQVLQNDFAFLLETDNRPEIALCTLLVAEHGRIRSKGDHNIIGTVFEKALAEGFTAYPRGLREAFPHDSILAKMEAESLIATPLCDTMGRPIGLIGVIGRHPISNIDVSRQTLQIFAARAAAEIARKQEAEVLASKTERLQGDFTMMRDTAERERKRYEEDIAAEQELLAVTLRSIREGCITTDNDGLIMMVNPVAEDLTGWTQPEAADRKLGEVVQLVSHRAKRPFDANLILDAPDQLAAQMVLISREGTQRVVEVSAAPIRNRHERKLGTVLVLRDVTERIRAEEEYQKAEKLESLGLAAGGIAHDFNNLLTAIIGNLSLAAQQVEPNARQRIEASKKASLRAQDLAQQLLTFAKGGAPIKKTASMRQLVLDTVGFSLSGTNVRPVFEISEDLCPVDIDAGQISQVIGNLAVNAVQAMRTGGTLMVRGSNLDFTAATAPIPLPAGRYIGIEVEDEGPGIPEETLKKIFDPYFTTKPKGSGLGLATSYSIVKNHNGLIRVESPPKRGAIFSIYLPASEAEIAPEVTPLHITTRRKGRVLVMDDEEIICELVDYALTPLGYRVGQALDAKTALRLYEEAAAAGEPYDVVIMDLTIPGGMGGKEAVKKLKELDPKARAIVSSGYAMDPIMSRFRDYGFCGVIAKPYDVDELEVAISHAIAQDA